MALPDPTFKTFPDPDPTKYLEVPPSNTFNNLISLIGKNGPYIQFCGAEVGAGKKMPGAEACQTRTGSATLLQKVLNIS